MDRSHALRVHSRLSKANSPSRLAPRRASCRRIVSWQWAADFERSPNPQGQCDAYRKAVGAYHAGVKAWYDPAELVGKQVVIVANLEPRKLRGEISQGMILAASDLKDAPAEETDGKPGPDERDVVVMTIDKPVKPGSRVS